MAQLNVNTDTVSCGLFCSTKEKWQSATAATAGSTVPLFTNATTTTLAVGGTMTITMYLWMKGECDSNGPDTNDNLIGAVVVGNPCC